MIIESGFPDLDITDAMGVFAPAATLKEAIGRLSAEIVRVVQRPEVKDGMSRDGFIVAPLGPAEYDALSAPRWSRFRRSCGNENHDRLVTLGKRGGFGFRPRIVQVAQFGNTLCHCSM